MTENIIGIIIVVLAVVFFISIIICKSKIGWSWINNKKEKRKDE